MVYDRGAAPAATYDLCIRNGTIVDGLGGEPYVGDVAVADGVIAAVGSFDGDAMGNCGVGFAPCRASDHDTLVDVMAGVEDIPGVVMADGLPWDWETFPEYLDALDSRKRDIDVAAYLPHSPLRVYVMGQRGADREPATREDLARMRELAKQAIEVGALGFASSRFSFHKTASGELIPTYDAAQAEIAAIADGVAEGGGGLIQFVPDIAAGGYANVLQQVFEAAQDAGLPVTFTLATGNSGDPIWPDAITMIEKFNADGSAITAQMFPRPIGLVIGLELTGNPFVFYPSYREIADLPLAERVAEMRKPEVRARILADKPAGGGHPLLYLAQAWEWIFPLTDDPIYEPDASTSIAARARARGVTPMEEAYDRLLDDDGHAMLLVAMANFENNSLDTVGRLIRRDDVVLGLGDGGAHYGMICDASYPTFLLAHWARDRKANKLSVPEAIRMMTSVPARVGGLADRGRIAVGYKADLNVIDHAALRLHKPVITHDLPAGGRRLDQEVQPSSGTQSCRPPVAVAGESGAALRCRTARAGTIRSEVSVAWPVPSTISRLLLETAQLA